MKFGFARACSKNVEAVCILAMSAGLMSCGAAPQTDFTEQPKLSFLPAAESPEPPQASFENKCFPVSDLAQNQITRLEEEIWGNEYCGGRSGVKTETVEVILVTVEGACRDNKTERKGGCGNNYQRYMLGIKDGEVLETIAVGGTFDFLASGVTLQGQDVILYGEAYTATDAKCCPSLPETRTYKIIENYFVEVF